MSTNDLGKRGVQGAGDKQVPLILNVMNTDVVGGIASMPTAIKIANICVRQALPDNMPDHLR